MAQPVDFLPGGYRYLPGGFQYSAAVQALPGFRIERVALETPVPLVQGFALVEAYLQRLGRPTSALCAMELRSAAPMAEPEFIAFNRLYVQTLERWGLFRDDRNPVARCNLIPAADAPAEAVLHAFSHTVPLGQGEASSRVGDFISSGAAECPDRPNYRASIVRLGETTPDALRDKLSFALGDLESRLVGLGVGWRDVAQTRLYTVHDLHPLLGPEFAARGALAGGLCWHWVRPPVQDLEIEIDALRVGTQRLLAAG